MPAVIAPALIALAPELGATLFTIGGTAVTAASALSYGIATGVTLGAQFGLNRLLRKKGQKADPQISQFTIRQPLPVRMRAYGRNKLGGALFFEEAVPVTNAALTLGLIHCEGPVDAIESWWLNDSNTGIASALGGINTSLPWVFYIALESRLGDSGNASVNSLLVPYGWTGNLDGLCYTAMQCRQPVQPEKNFQYYYPNGVPAVRVIARCAKVFDPRDGTQLWSDPSTWKWSRNPALIIMDYLTSALSDASGVSIPRGMGLPKSKINLAYFAAFANMCDAEYPTTYSYDLYGNVIIAAGTEPRYCCDGAYTMEEAPTDVLGRMLSTCDGSLYTLADGTIGIRGGTWTAPTVAIDDSMIISADFSQGNDKFSSFNQLKISVTATNMDYQVVEGSPLDDFDDQDVNGVIAQDLQLPFVHSYSQARRLAKIDMAKGNPRWRYNSLVCTLAALNALGEEFVHVTHSLAGIDEDFIVLNFKLVGGTTCELQLASIDSSAYDWDEATEDLPPPGPNIPVTAVPPDVPIVAEIFSGNSAVGFATVSNPAPVVVILQPGGTAAVVASYEVQSRIVGASVWNSTTGSSAGTVILSGYSLGNDIEIRARAISTGGVDSGWTATIMHVVGASTLGAGPITAPLALNINVSLGHITDPPTPSVFEDLGRIIDAPPDYFVSLGHI